MRSFFRWRPGLRGWRLPRRSTSASPPVPAPEPALTGHDPRDPFSLGEPVDHLGALGRSLDGVRIAYSPDFGMYPVDAKVAAVVAEAVTAFREAGATVDEIDLVMAGSPSRDAG